MSNSNPLVIAAVSGLLLGASACKTSNTGAGAAEASAEEAESEGRHACRGLNECKGQGGCKVDGKHECKGLNECKGQGGCATS